MDATLWNLENPRFHFPWCIMPGTILEGEDILMATMSLAAAKVRCTGLPNCIGFYSEDWPFEGNHGDVRAEAGMKSSAQNVQYVRSCGPTATYVGHVLYVYL